MALVRIAEPTALQLGRCYNEDRVVIKHIENEERPLRSLIAADIRRTYGYLNGNPLLRLMVCAAAPGVHAAIVYRLGHWAKGRGVLIRAFVDPIYHLLNIAVKALWGIELNRSAEIGPGLYIGHFAGIIVSGRAVIGANCNLSQNVTIGVEGGENAGAPTIGDDVYIAPGAKVFGKIRIGNNAKIGANAVVGKDIPDNAVVALAPGFQIVSMQGNKRAPGTKRVA